MEDIKIDQEVTPSTIFVTSKESLRILCGGHGTGTTEWPGGETGSRPQKKDEKILDE